MNKKHFSTQMAKDDQKDSNHRTPNPQGPPPYFDSEPSSQPPSCGKISSKATPHRSSAPASAASIAAILGPTPEKEPKRTWADRWKDLKSGERYGGKSNKDIDRRESSSKWNAHGIVLGDRKKRTN